MFLRTRLKRINPKTIFSYNFILDTINGVHKFSGAPLDRIFRTILELNPHKFISNTRTFAPKFEPQELENDLTAVNRFLYALDFRKVRKINLDEQYNTFFSEHNISISFLTDKYFETKSYEDMEILKNVFHTAYKYLKLESKLLDEAFTIKVNLLKFVKNIPEYKKITHIRNSIVHHGENESYCRFIESTGRIELKDVDRWGKSWQENISFEKMIKITTFLLGTTLITFIYSYLLFLELYGFKVDNRELLKL